ncbi:hypothetical protein D3C84_1047160 [compost metagenome]
MQVGSQLPSLVHVEGTVEPPQDLQTLVDGLPLALILPGQDVALGPGDLVEQAIHQHQHQLVRVGARRLGLGGGELIGVVAFLGFKHERLTYSGNTGSPTHNAPMVCSIWFMVVN